MTGHIPSPALKRDGIGRLAAQWQKFLAAASVAMLGAAGPAAAQNLNIDRIADRALSTLGFVVVPARGAPFLSFADIDGTQNSFRSGQVGGGFNPVKGSPFYLEGYIGYQSYEPEFLLRTPLRDVDVDAEWQGIAATAGFGWDFPLAENWVFRPILNLSYGRASADATITGTAPDDEDLNFLIDGDINAGGYGASLVLAYERFEARRDVGFSLRYTDMLLVPLGSASDLDAEARVTTATAWGRLRYPIRNWQAFGEPVKSVFQASLSAFPGDQGDVVDLPWVARVGVGIQIGTEKTGVPLISATRLMVSYSFSDNYDAVGIGLGLSF